MTDTPPEIAEIVRARPLARSSAERFRVGIGMVEARRTVPVSWPADLAETARKRCLCERLYGTPLPANP